MKMLALALAAGALTLTAPASALTGANTIETPEAKAASAELAQDAYADFVKKFDRTSLKPNQYVWNDKGAKGEPRIVVSLEKQMAFAYRGDTLVGAASVSTAKEGKITPTGIFPVWLKKPMHYSKKYDNAPMPYMQMIDQYGIALHAGHNPGYPASAGCIRLPKDFAKNIYAMTNIGTTVHIGA
ncbi:L,D-transpeptidase family protein [Sphingomicrobium lutaoense]|uniref:Lipoprotein-anchoring transpeptidase ErfK/SrfK n=1 Tax=Sphingomicrobium lutaoense TaxID=515949 RepID=A0A839Z3K2_9SPHN|nr:L,D-transpeptidase family protein [Sphingomicrobium lutaoense]MBB3764182.1 lipoprotein-anchoring transpeptidase ErfK/SrfK [Sphingomicrobium lutaoense]